MPRIPRQDIENIQKQADIADIISRFVPLEKKGKEYVGVCPFHDDHDPSMHVSPEKGIFKCFVCGTGGDVFRFFEKFEGLNFTQSVERVAGLVNYPLPEVQADLQRKKQDPKAPLYHALDVYRRYCAYELLSMDGQQAMAYLKERKFTPELLKKFSIGYAPSSSMSLGYLEASHIAQSDLLRTGIASQNGENLRAAFEERIMIPIEDAQGRTVGFTARILPGSSGLAKYVNTASTELYQKSSLIFNYHRVRNTCRKSGRVVLVEGAMDVLGLEKAGIQDGLACLGTAITDEQIQMLKALNTPVTVFYDADRAGRDAVWHFGNLALKAGLPFMVASWKGGKDPDEIYCTQGAQAVLKAVSATVSFTEFAFDYLKGRYDLSNYENKKAYASTLRSLIQTNLEPFERASWLERLEQETGFHYSEAASVMPGEKPVFRRPRQTMVPLPAVLPGVDQAEKTVLYAMLCDARYADRFRQELGFFSLEACQMLSLYIYQAYRTISAIDPIALEQVIDEPEVQELLHELCGWPDKRETIEQEFEDALIRLHSSLYDRQIQSLQSQVRQVSREGDLPRALQLSKEIRELTAKKLKLRQGKADPF